MDVIADEPEVALTGGVAGVRPEHRHERMHVGEDDAPAGAQDAGKLSHGALDLGAVGERQRADGEVARPRRQRQRRQVGEFEVSCRNLLPGLIEHLRRCVDSCDGVTERVQLARVPSRTAGRVQGGPHGVPVEELPHDRLLREQYRVPRSVVPEGPLAISDSDAPLVLNKRAGPGQLLTVLHDLGHARCPCCHGVGVNPPSPKDGQPFEPQDEVAEGGLLVHDWSPAIHAMPVMTP